MANISQLQPLFTEPENVLWRATAITLIPVILLFCAYDTAAHRYGPEAKESLNILAREAEIFQHIAEAMEKYKGTHRTLLAYAPDHGQHPLMDGGGQHGSKMIEDMNIVHFFGTK